MTGEIAMAIYDPAIDDWNCTSTGNLPNDTSVPSDTVTGLPHNCSRNMIAVWNKTLTEWDCSQREALVYQTEPYIPDQFCRDGDLLTINQDYTATWINRPGALCVNSQSRQVGPEASVQLKRTIVSKNSGDPDETFFVQSTSKAIGNFSQTVAREHDKWQYWAWSPIRSGFTSSLGTYPPILPFDGLHLVSVISNTYSWANNVYSAFNIPISFNVVALRVNITGVYPNISYMNFVATNFTSTPIVAPGIVNFNGGSNALPNVTLTKYEAFSIQITSFPASGFTSSPKNNWFAVSLWFSYITKEA
jgi:hypothetical protein